ncbi:unnamed protein product [Brassica rapa subsp. narinosa]
MSGNVSTTRILNYDSKTHAIDSQISRSFSIRIREVERTIVRSSIDGRENLVKQRTLASSAVVKFEIPPCFLAGEEICNRWIQLFILPKIFQDAMRKKTGFLVEAQIVQQLF